MAGSQNGDGGEDGEGGSKMVVMVVGSKMVMVRK